MSRSAPEPEAVTAARQTLRTHRRIVLGTAVLFWPLLVASGMLGFAGFVGFLGLAAAGAVAWAVAGWTKKTKNAKALLEAWERKQLERALEPPVAEARPAAPLLAASHPLHAIAERLSAQGTTEPQIQSVVDGLLAQLVKLEADLAALRPDVEAALAADPDGDDPRLQRMQSVLTKTEAAQTAVVDALRDLHLALTARPDEDRGTLLESASDVLARLAAETEVDAVTSPTPTLRPQKAPATH